MSGSVNYLTSLFSSSFGSGDPLLNALYGTGSQSAASSGQTPVQALTSAEQNQTKDVKLTAAQPTVQRAITTFTQAVNGAKSVTQLLANPAVMNVLLTAAGMTDQIGYTALATQALTSNLSDPQSLANRLTDTRWKTLAQQYNFATTGLKTIQNPAAITAVANGYAQATWQTQQDAVTPGLSNALSFRASASTITSVDQILADPTMRTVVTTALGVPQEIAFQSLNAQEKAISSVLDITKFKDPKFVESFVQRYLIANAANTASTPTSTPDLTTLAVQGQGFLA
jgi:hypothetical protein